MSRFSSTPPKLHESMKRKAGKTQEVRLLENTNSCERTSPETQRLEANVSKERLAVKSVAEVLDVGLGEVG